jgi:hypothetical protein
MRSVDEDMLHPCRELMWFLEGGVVGDGGGIEDDNVGKHAFTNEPPAIQLKVRRRQPRELSDGFRERNDFFVPNVLS